MLNRGMTKQYYLDVYLLVLVITYIAYGQDFNLLVSGFIHRYLMRTYGIVLNTPLKYRYTNTAASYLD